MRHRAPSGHSRTERSVTRHVVDAASLEQSHQYETYNQEATTKRAPPTEPATMAATGAFKFVVPSSEQHGKAQAQGRLKPQHRSIKIDRIGRTRDKDSSSAYRSLESLGRVARTVAACHTLLEREDKYSCSLGLIPVLTRGGGSTISTEVVQKLSLQYG